MTTHIWCQGTLLNSIIVRKKIWTLHVDNIMRYSQLNYRLLKHSWFLNLPLLIYSIRVQSRYWVTNHLSPISYNSGPLSSNIWEPFIYLYLTMIKPIVWNEYVHATTIQGLHWQGYLKRSLDFIPKSKGTGTIRN